MARRRVTAVLLDTHVWARTLTGRERLSPAAIAAVEGADIVMLRAASLFEIGQKVRLGEWPEMTPLAAKLHHLLEHQGVLVATLDGPTRLSAGTLSWEHRDPFDRLIAATALALGAPLVSADMAFDGIAQRIWSAAGQVAGVSIATGCRVGASHRLSARRAGCST